jgi:ABC-type spermidine/putrescine transport system permease subunit I
VTDPPGAGLSNYEQFFAQRAYVQILTNTFWIALLATVTCLLVGYPFAYLMTIAPGRFAGLLLIAVLLPFWSSLLVRTFAWQVILRDTGIINRFLLDLGLINEPLTLIRTTLGVIIGMSHILLPFMVLPLYAVMRRIDPEFGRAAANLGATPTTAFFRVFLPLSLPGILAGCLLVFILALGFYITPALLGGLRDQMISQLIVQQIQQRLDWGFGTAMSVLLVGITLLILLVMSRAVRLRDVFGSVIED